MIPELAAWKSDIVSRLGRRSARLNRFIVECILHERANEGTYGSDDPNQLGKTRGNVLNPF